MPAPPHAIGKPAMHTVNSRSTKAEILTAAAELTDLQAQQITDLQQRQTILLALLGLVAILQLI